MDTAAHIERLVRTGDMTAASIASETGAALNYVYKVARKAGLKTKRARRGENTDLKPVPFRPRPRAEILKDFSCQLEAIVCRFERQVAADRRSDPIR